tara:strand:+ start:773 stop:1117 length:345 start_codon:yes stop_codon:yes gene_type:complete
MKITKQKLKQIIKEEIDLSLNEQNLLNENLQAAVGATIINALMNTTSAEGARFNSAKSLYNALTAIVDGLLMTEDIYQEQGKQVSSQHGQVLSELEAAKKQLAGALGKLRSAAK